MSGATPAPTTPAPATAARARRRVPWAGRFARTLALTVATHVALSTLAGVCLYLVIDFVEVGNFISDKSDGALLARLTLLNLPRVLRMMVPVAAPIGVLTAVGALVRRREVEAMLAAGASPLVVATPVLCCGLVLGALHAANVELGVPPSAIEVGALRKKLGLGSGPLEAYQKRQAWFRGRDLVYRVGRLADRAGTRAEDVLVLRLGDGRLLERWDLGALVRQGDQWIGEDVVFRRFDEGATLSSTRAARIVVPVRETPQDFVLSVAPPERMPLLELWATAEARERLGRDSPAHWTELGRRFVTPLGIVLSMLLASAIALRIGRRPTLARALGLGAGLGAGVWLVSDLAALLGGSGALGAWPAALVLPVVLLSATAVAGRAALRHGLAE